MIPQLLSSPVSASASATTTLYQQFLAELQARGFEGDMSQHYADRTVLATDNSIYQVWPQAIVFPKTTADVQRIAALTAEERFRSVVLAARGGGTGTNGQSLTDGLVVDLSRHMNRILEIDPAGQWVQVEAGVVKDQLNAALKPHGLFFAPELSTSNRATIGGMVNTDASGQGSCLYGKTRDYVEELEIVLLGGDLWHSYPLETDQLAAIQARNDRIGELHRIVDSLHAKNRALIAERFPPLNRCLTGYDLAHIRDGQERFDLNSILCGSEGTLGFITKIRLRVIPIPRYSALINIPYSSFDAALRAAPSLMQLGAASIETIDAKIVELAQADSIWAKVAGYFPANRQENASEATTQAINLVEFVSDDKNELDATLTHVGNMLKNSPSPHRLGYTIAHGQAVQDIWKMRKKSVGLLGNMKGAARPVPFVEDTAVPPENLADYIAEFRAILDRHGLVYGMFGHVDAGVLHVRPALDMKEPGQLERIREITDEVYALTRKYNGLLWGEHGKGFRSEYVPDVFGPLYPVLQRIKALFDPFNQLNPGKIATPLPEAHAEADIGTHTATPHEKTNKAATLTALDAVPIRGHFDRIIPLKVRENFDEALHCNGNGACYNYDPNDTMCPSWKVTRERRHSPKGRASLMREWLRQLIVAGYEPAVPAAIAPLSFSSFFPRAYHTLTARFGRADFSHEVKEAMDGCLACKSCVGQCPIQVDVPTFRSKFLALYHTRYLRPLHNHLVANLEHLLPWLARHSLLRHAYNIALDNALGRAAMRVTGLVNLPRLSPVMVWQEAARLGVETATPERMNALDQATRDRSVIVVQDAMTTHFDSTVVIDLLKLLKQLGYTPWLAPYLPSGKPLHVLGFLARFQHVAFTNATMLKKLADTGIELIGLDPSLTLTYRSEYAKTLSPETSLTVRLPQEWLASRLHALPASPMPSSVSRPAHEKEWLLALHCTEKSTLPTATADWQQVFTHFGLTVKAIDVGCCGMAGLYGHELDHQATSHALYELSWATHVRDKTRQKQMMATGYSCRCQSKIIDNVELKHPVQVLSACLPPL